MNGHGEIVVRLSKDKIKIISMTGKTKVVKLPETKDGKLSLRYAQPLAVDKTDNIYVASYLERSHLGTYDDFFITCELNVLDDSYNLKHIGTLPFLDAIHSIYLGINISSSWSCCCC